MAGRSFGERTHNNKASPDDHCKLASALRRYCFMCAGMLVLILPCFCRVSPQYQSHLATNTAILVELGYLWIEASQGTAPPKGL